MKRQMTPRTVLSSMSQAAITCWVIALLMTSFSNPLLAQPDPGYHPINQNWPPGQAAAWMNAIRGYDPAWLQPVRVELPTGGTVSIFSASTNPQGMLTTPAQFGVNAGHLYRLRLSEMPEFPGEELYPSIEILDHLHPPIGQENDYPIPIVFTAEDIRLALAGKFVTRVVYLEQPQISATLDPLRREIPQAVPSSENALQEADRLGRPMVIVRLGGRHPSEYDESLSFFGTGGGVDIRPIETSRPGVARLSSGKSRRDSVASR